MLETHYKPSIYKHKASDGTQTYQAGVELIEKGIRRWTSHLSLWATHEEAMEEAQQYLKTIKASDIYEISTQRMGRFLRTNYLKKQVELLIEILKRVHRCLTT